MVEHNNENERSFIKGTLRALIYHNEENLFTIAKINIKETNEGISEKEIVVTGSFPILTETDLYIFYGAINNHEKYGVQYQVTDAKKELPDTKEGIVQYLSSDLFSGVGKKTAEMIVEKFGTNAIQKIMATPSLLEEIPRLSEQKAKEFVEKLHEHQGFEQIMEVLTPYGIGPSIAMKIFQKYKMEALDIINTNPYALIHDIEGIGFKRADDIAKNMGIPPHHPQRIQAGCLFIVQEASKQQGHVYITLEQQIIAARQLLSAQVNKIEESDIAREIIALGEEKKLIVAKDKVYLPSLYYAETQLTDKIVELASNNDLFHHFAKDDFYKALGELEERINVQYAKSQVEAIQQALQSPFLLLTGGPGTGKTTVIKGIIELYSELHGVSLDIADYKKGEPFPIVLVAPTGRAAKRMNESTGIPAVTIHRLLGWKGDQFEKDEQNKIEGKLLIVDEVSMVDLPLANHLFKSLPDDIQVVLVGDEDQLPSVGPGQVLADLLRSKVLPTVTLKDIYRQEEGSSIIELAHEIKDGAITSLESQKKDRSFFPCGQHQVIDVIEKVCLNAINKGYSARDIQILAPIYRGDAGIDYLNERLQALFNPPAEKRRELKAGTRVFRTGDKVLQLVNNPEQQVFNGDIGEITSIFFAKENTEKEDQVVVDYDGKEVVYPRKELQQIMLAYCCSIHKSQGSEFPIVILPMISGYHRMLQRNLLYTAITRSKDFLILCGERHAFAKAVSDNNKGKRQTMLAQNIQEQIGKISPTS
ncbi:ATP-dependent RecD-like DNA helicase [Lottiidibacillus patelloidae]|uniref:ATP-dependent RecD2 DNA helicase n=1 Tax=Lottiidibacillus patelloidae TaxID=2670334 RepID=A0A263BVN0_9BACI|nr:ATP-dependent RecD-like DNA helicase [Lottiidibacillus patelloidae]OZM57811.1 ATP-dependent RecD-like DNA helicase [Lottiidibacillus patelloidae]